MLRPEDGVIWGLDACFWIPVPNGFVYGFPTQVCLVMFYWLTRAFCSTETGLFPVGLERGGRPVLPAFLGVGFARIL